MINHLILLEVVVAEFQHMQLLSWSPSTVDDEL